MNDKLLKIQQELKAPKQGCTVYLSDEAVAVGDRVYIKATATLASGEDRLWVHAFARETDVKKGMDASQITGSASSYARKHALNGLFAIDDTKDADTDEARNMQSKPDGLDEAKAKVFAKFKSKGIDDSQEMMNVLDRAINKVAIKSVADAEKVLEYLDAN